MLRSNREHFGIDFRQLIHDRFHAGAKTLWRPWRSHLDITSRSAPLSTHRIDRFARCRDRLEHDGASCHGERRLTDRETRHRIDHTGGYDDDASNHDNDNDNRTARCASCQERSDPPRPRGCNVLLSKVTLNLERLPQPNDHDSSSDDRRNPHDGRPHDNHDGQEPSGHQGATSFYLEPVGEHRSKPELPCLRSVHVRIWRLELRQSMRRRKCDRYFLAWLHQWRCLHQLCLGSDQQRSRG